MALFNDILRSLPLRKDVSVGDVHVSTAIGNEAEDEVRRGKKKRPRPQAFIAQTNVRQVVPEERGVATNAEGGPEGKTVKSLAFDQPIHGHHLDRRFDARGVKKQAPFHPTLVGDATERSRAPVNGADDGLTEDDDTETDATTKRYDSAKDLPDAVKDRIKGKKKRRQWMHVFNSELGRHGDESRAFASAWSTVKKDRSDALSGQPMVGVGGRRLEPFDAGTFFVPMKYNPAALSYLRPDQVPRVLDAITHPERLPIMPMRIDDLVATKGRVSRDTIQKHLAKMAESKGRVEHDVSGEHQEGVDDLNPPVVCFFNGEFVMCDGHDRTVAMWLDGIDEIRVAFDNVDAYDNRKPDNDDTHRNTAYALLQGANGRTLTNYVDGTLAVPFMYNETFFAGLRPDQVPKFIFAITHADKLADAQVSLPTLVAIQNRVNIDTVAAKVEKPWKKPPVIVRVNGVDYIGDGHDRLTASWLRGDDEVTVKLTDITWADNAMKPADVEKAAVEDRAKAREELAVAEDYVKRVADAAAEAERVATEKRAEADRVAEEARVAAEAKVAEADRVATEKRAEVERIAEEARVAAEKRMAETDRKREKVKLKSLAVDDQFEEMARKSKKLKAYVVEQQENVDHQVSKILRDAEKAREEADRYALKKRVDAERAVEMAELQVEKLVEAADRYALDKRAEADRAEPKTKDQVEAANRYALGKRADADRVVERAQFQAEKLIEAADRYALEKRAEADRAEPKTKEQAEAADRYALTKRADADRAVEMAELQVEKMVAAADAYALEKRQEVDRTRLEVEKQLEEAERYVQYVVKAKRKGKRKREDVAAYADRVRREADRYATEKRVEIEKYVSEKRSSADEYDVEKRREADAYESDAQLRIERKKLGARLKKNKRERESLLKLEKIMSPVAEQNLADIRSGDSKLQIDIQKVKKSKHQVFGWASIVTKDGIYVVDKQSDVIPVEELELAVYDYMLRSREGGHLHVVKGVSRCIESAMLSNEKQRAMGIELRDDDGKSFEGWWTGWQVDSPEVWSAIESGALPELSIGGQAISTKID